MNDVIELCGQCGKVIPDGVVTCPSCGALLAAYRTPSDSSSATEFAGTAVEPALDAAATVAPTAPVEVPPIEPDEIDYLGEYLDDAPVTGDEDNLNDVAGRSEEHEPAIQPEVREMVIGIDAAPADPPPSAPVVVPTPMPGPVRPPVKSAARTSRTRKPGYVTRGTVEPVLFWGIISLVLAICLVGLGSLFSSRGMAIIGLVLGAIGIIAVVVSVLIALVRREGGQ